MWQCSHSCSLGLHLFSNVTLCANLANYSCRATLIVPYRGKYFACRLFCNFGNIAMVTWLTRPHTILYLVGQSQISGAVLGGLLHALDPRLSTAFQFFCTSSGIFCAAYSCRLRAGLGLWRTSCREQLRGSQYRRHIDVTALHCLHLTAKRSGCLV